MCAIAQGFWEGRNRIYTASFCIQQRVNDWKQY